MARTPLFSWLKRVSQKSRQAALLDKTAQDDGFLSQPITRRDFLKTTLAATVTGAALANGLQIPSLAHGPKRKPLRPGMSPVVIVGAGLAGLTAAYRLLQAGIPSVIYEASSRLGGRMYTKEHFNTDNMFVELGGELVDTGHEELIALCREMRVPLEKFAHGDAGLEAAIYYSRGKICSEKDVIRAFKPLARAMQEDLRKSFPKGEAQVPTYQKPYNAQWLDQISLGAYLDSKTDVESWFIELLKVAYICEYGLEVNEQSALNLLLLIGLDTDSDFQIFGDSDEALRIQGGNRQLIQALSEALQPHIPILPRHRLTAIAQLDDHLTLTFNQGSQTIGVHSRHTILAIPFTILRTVTGLDQLSLSPIKRDMIENLGYGTNSKQMIGFQNRFWRKDYEDGKVEAPANTGSLFTDWPSQTYWETSRLQHGRAGILTNFLGGRTGKNAESTQWQKALSDLNQLYPKASKKFDGNTAFFNWHKHPLALGSYSCPKPGQYTSMIGAGMEPELNGQLLFVGEHCSVNNMGYMNGAVETANEVARQLIFTLSKIPMEPALSPV